MITNQIVLLDDSHAPGIQGGNLGIKQVQCSEGSIGLVPVCLGSHSLPCLHLKGIAYSFSLHFAIVVI